MDAIRGFDKSKIKSRRKRAPKPQKKKLSLMDEIRAAKLKKGRKKVRRKAPAKEAEAKPNSVAALLDMRREEMGYDEDEEGGYQSSSSEWGSDDD